MMDPVNALGRVGGRRRRPQRIRRFGGSGKKTQSMVEGALVEEESKTAGAARDAAEGARREESRAPMKPYQATE